MRRALDARARRKTSPVPRTPSIPAAQYLMTGGSRAGYRWPGHGQGGLQLGNAVVRRRSRNSTMVIDETADVEEAACNTRSARPLTTVPAAPRTAISSSRRAYDALRERLVAEGGHVASADETEYLTVLDVEDGRRTPDTIAISAQAIAQRGGFELRQTGHSSSSSRRRSASTMSSFHAERPAVDVPLLGL